MLLCDKLQILYAHHRQTVLSFQLQTCASSSFFEDKGFPRVSKGLW